MIPACATPRVRDRLAAAPDGPVPVLHVAPRAVYVEVSGWCVGVVSHEAVQVPCALRLRPGAQSADFLPGAGHRAYLEGGTLCIGGVRLPIRRLVGAYVPPLGDPAFRRTDPVTVEATPPATVAGFVASHLPHRRLDADDVRRLLGRGEGLTPLGDDVLAGWLAMFRAAGEATPAVDAAIDAAIEGARNRTTLLSATLLDCARHGEVLPQYADWVRALGTAAEPAAVRALHAVGATSGAGLHAGGTLALDQLREAA